MDMKKGDKVLVIYDGEWTGAIYDFCYEGRHFATIEGCKYSMEFPHCKPAKQSVKEWTVQWIINNSKTMASGLGDEYLLKFYEDIKALEESQ